MDLPQRTSDRNFRRVLLVAGLAALCLWQTGCVRRRLTVRTSPPGAQVFVDDQEIGASPASTSFVYYGTRKITVIKDGYETTTLYEKISAPWYEYPPIDFVSENLWPFETRDERVVDVQLLPQQVVPEDQLLNRADLLRNNAANGQTIGLPGAQAGFLAPVQPQKPVIGLPGQGVFGQPAAGEAPLPPELYPTLKAPPSPPGVIVPPR